MGDPIITLRVLLPHLWSLLLLGFVDYVYCPQTIHLYKERQRR